MAYVTYTTDAIVCGSVEYGAADRIFFLFTEDAGMVSARGTSVREEKSKMRFALTDFSYARVSLVRGKYGWKIVGAASEDNVYFALTDRYARGAVRNLLRLVRRVITGEEGHAKLFHILIDGVELIRKRPADAEVLELLVVLRMLHALGYISPRAEYRRYLDTDTLADISIPENYALPEKALIKRVIEEAYDVSQL